MYQAIPKNSTIFSPEVVDELNSALSKTNDKIEQFHPTALEHKYTVRDISITGKNNNIVLHNNSFCVEHEKWISLSIDVQKDIECDDTILAELSDPPDADVITTLIEKGTIVPWGVITIENRSIKAPFGKLEKGKSYLLSCWYLTSGI